MIEELYAQLHVAYYKWPEDDQWRVCFIMETNCDDDELAAKACGISDESVLLYTDNTDPDYIKRHFDGVEIKIVNDAVAFRRNPIYIQKGECNQ